MSFSELDELAKWLDEPGELPADSVEARLSANEAALEKLQEQQTLLVDQQARLLQHVTGLARHLVRSPEARAISTSDQAASSFSAPLAVPLVGPTDISENAFSTLSGQDAPAGNSSARVFSGEVPLPPHAPAGVTSVSQLTFQLSPKEASLQPFSGSSDKSSTVLDNDTFIDLQEWFSASVWKLSAAGVPSEVHAALLAQKLFGPIQKVFILELEMAPVQVTTLSALQASVTYITDRVPFTNNTFTPQCSSFLAARREFAFSWSDGGRTDR
jgi:hypothetical protein